MKLTDVFDSPQSREEGTILFIDITNSTEIKEKEAEVTWIGSYARIYDCVREQIRSEEGGHIVKYLGDAAMAFFDGEHTTQAINAAIRMQEYIEESNTAKVIKGFHCSIGIASGNMVKFSTSDDKDDYIGVVVDRVARLCSSASANATFVDEETIDSAHLGRIRSRIGEALSRRAADYRGEFYNLSLKGFPKPIACYEILWGQDRFGIRTPVASVPPPPPPPPDPEEDDDLRSDVADYRSGWLERWSQDGRYAFIQGDDGVSYFTNPSVIIGEDMPNVGDRVFFLKRHL
jgi:class 3 adenylate cyclase